MGENLTVRQKSKLAYLKRLCVVWSRFLEIKYSRIDVFVEQGRVNIFMYQFCYPEQPDGGRKRDINYLLDECKLSQITEKIKEYKINIRREFKIRHKSESEKDEIRSRSKAK